MKQTGDHQGLNIQPFRQGYLFTQVGHPHGMFQAVILISLVISIIMAFIEPLKQEGFCLLNSVCHRCSPISRYVFLPFAQIDFINFIEKVENKNHGIYQA